MNPERLKIKDGILLIQIMKEKANELLNQMDIDMVISGHQHDLLVFEPGTVTPNEKLTYNSEYKPGKTYKVEEYRDMLAKHNNVFARL